MTIEQCEAAIIELTDNGRNLALAEEFLENIGVELMCHLVEYTSHQFILGFMVAWKACQIEQAESEISRLNGR